MSEKKIYILASEELADECMVKAMNWYISHPKFKHTSSESSIISVSEYLANLKGFTMYTDVADYPKDIK